MAGYDRNPEDGVITDAGIQDRLRRDGDKGWRLEDNNAGVLASNATFSTSQPSILIDTTPESMSSWWRQSFGNVHLGSSCRRHMLECFLWTTEMYRANRPQPRTLEVDDIFWEDSNPDKLLKQPPDQPSMIAFWVHSLKISR
ncbi:Gypsy retrotransposon integrase-like protein 1, partial [Marasmius sp. AFHP31]